MRLGNARDVGLYVRTRRRDLSLTQADLSKSAGVSRRWLSDLERGKTTAEIGLVFKVLHALELTVEAKPIEFGPNDIDLDEIMRSRGHDLREGGRG